MTSLEDRWWDIAASGRDVLACSSAVMPVADRQYAPESVARGPCVARDDRPLGQSPASGPARRVAASGQR